LKLVAVTDSGRKSSNSEEQVGRESRMRSKSLANDPGAIGVEEEEVKAAEKNPR